MQAYMQPVEIVDGLRAREEFAISLRKKKKELLITAKRQKLLSKVRPGGKNSPLSQDLAQFIQIVAPSQDRLPSIDQDLIASMTTDRHFV